MSSNFDSIKLSGKSLRPAPFVSTTYEYNKFEGYIVGGFLVVTLSGTLVDKNLGSKISELNALQANQDCVNLTIGCADSGGQDFLNGDGRIRSVDIDQGDQPYIANYTIVVAIETMNGAVVVVPDPDFATNLGLAANEIPKFIQSYSESITIDGSADIIGSSDSGMSISKSYIKASGSINMKVYTNYICGLPSYNPNAEIASFLTARYSAIVGGRGSSNPLANFTSWQKWLDTKSLEIQTDGNVTWTFDLYMTSGGGTPMAFVDVNTTDKLEQKTKMKSRSLSGSIKGLSLATISDHIGHKADSNERIANAQTVFNALDSYLKNGQWPGYNVVLSGEEGGECEPPECPERLNPICYQRISHNITKSVVAGEISFSMEFADINACKPMEFELDITIDETLPSTIIQETLIPNRQIKPNQLYPRSIIHKIAEKTETVTITVRGSLLGCEKEKMVNLINCARKKIQEIITSYYPDAFGWRYKRETENIATYSYTIMNERNKCNYFV